MGVRAACTAKHPIGAGAEAKNNNYTCHLPPVIFYSSCATLSTNEREKSASHSHQGGLRKIRGIMRNCTRLCPLCARWE